MQIKNCSLQNSERLLNTHVDIYVILYFCEDNWENGDRKWFYLPNMIRNITLWIFCTFLRSCIVCISQISHTCIKISSC